jgi:protein-S-isoprenylcysteine O-methyltransferase Ste14
VTFPKPYADTVQRLRVPGGFLLLGSFLLLSNPSLERVLWGLPVSFLGLLIRSWAAGHLEKNENLTTSGPYAHVRNPLYAGSLLLAGGLVIGSRSWAVAAIFTFTFLLIYLPVIQLEEQHLRKLFQSYKGYAERVPSLLPRLTPAGDGKPFRMSLYHRNKEWRALSGYLFGLVYLLVRSYLA